MPPRKQRRPERPSSTPAARMAERVAAVRRFSRFYTRRIGVLQEGLNGSDLTLTEGRLVFEIAQADGSITAVDLAGLLGLDAGYLSRQLKALEERGLIVRRPAEGDARRSLIALTAKGRAAFASIDRRSAEEVAALVAPLTERQQQDLVAALATAERLLGDTPQTRTMAILRSPRIGDFGIVASRHGALYAEEYGWDGTFEALVAKVAAEFIEMFDAGKERCWIAEMDGRVVGSVFLVRKDDHVAKLRLLYLEPEARGLGLGRRLVEECMAEARRIGYRRMTLWTNDVLTAARTIYVRCGFTLVHSEPHHSFGVDLVGETWERDL